MTGVTVKNGDTDITNKVKVLTYDDEEALTDLGVYDDFEEFNYNITGVYTIYYQVTDGGVTETETKEISVEQKHNISNGDFGVTANNGFYNWTLDTPGGTAKVETVTENGVKKPKLDVTSAGNNWFSLQYISKCNLLEGETYQITVRAKSTNGKSFAFGFEDPSNNYSMMQGLTAYTAGTDYADYVSYYTADKDYTNAKAVLYFGYILEEKNDIAYDLTLDSIKIEKVEKCPNVAFTGLDNKTFTMGTEALDTFLADPLAGVTAKSGETDLTDKIQVVGNVSKNVMEATRFTLAYVVPNANGPIAVGYRTIQIKLNKEHDYSLVNGTFDSDIRYWVQDVNAQNPGKAKFEWAEGTDKEGAAKITIENPSSDGWHIQFRQDISLKANTNYVIKIRAKASIERSIQLEINAGSNYAYNIDLKTEYTEKVIYFSAPANASGFRFLLGGGGVKNEGSIIWIDSAEITLDADQSQYESWQMVNPTFASGDKMWGGEGAAFTAGSDSTGTYLKATVSDNLGGNDAWRTQLRQDGKAFEKGVTYKLIVKAKASKACTINYEINPNKNWSTSGNIELTTDVKTFEFEFTPTENTSESRVGLLLNGAGRAGTEITFYQFEIVKVQA